MALRPNVGHCLLNLEVSRSHDAWQSVGHLWTSDQLVTETSTWQHTTLTTYKHPCPRRDSNPQSQQASGRRPTPQIARPLGPANREYYFIKTCQFQGKLICGNKIQLYANKNKDVNWTELQLASVHLPQILTTCLLISKVKCLARKPDVKQKILENGILSGSRIVYGVEVWGLWRGWRKADKIHGKFLTKILTLWSLTALIGVVPHR